MREIWKPFPMKGFESLYSISSLGNVRRNQPTPYKPAGAICKLCNEKKTGFLKVTLFDGKKYTQHFVHTAVAKAFIPRPADPSKDHVKFLNGDRHDCRANNLAWVTLQELKDDAIASGRWKPKVCGMKSAMKTGTSIICITTGEKFLSLGRAYKKLHISTQKLRQLCESGEAYKGMKFTYLEKNHAD